MNNEQTHLGWLGIFRLGLVQAALGGIVVLTTSTMNRVMVVEMAMPAMLPGLLVALHYVVQVLRPRLGYNSDLGGRRTPWIIGGIALLGTAALAAAVAVSWMSTTPALAIALAVVAFALIGVGVGTSGTALLVLMAARVSEKQRAVAAMTTWLMMILGFIITSIVAGNYLDPFTPARLVQVTAGIAAAAFLLTLFAVLGIEGRHRTAPTVQAAGQAAPAQGFIAALREVWTEPHSRRLTIFIFFSMIAYSAQDLILEPFAGLIFHLTPGQSTKLSGTQNMGVLLGMLIVAIVCTKTDNRFGSIKSWTIGGCVASTLALITLSIAGLIGPGWPLSATVFMLGLSNGAFAVGAIGSMMGMVGEGRHSREGVRMGLWGAAQAMAFAIGGVVATGLVDLLKVVFHSTPMAYAYVFVVEAAFFMIAGLLAVQVKPRSASLTAPQSADASLQTRAPEPYSVSGSGR
jgi:BCD family chlorophyll transporter-like MFS transporter